MTLVLSALYLLAVYVGPKIMKDREPYKLKWALVIYNFALVIMNFHIASEVGCFCFFLNYLLVDLSVLFSYIYFL